jgi:hypothetical protein
MLYVTRKYGSCEGRQIDLVRRKARIVKNWVRIEIERDKKDMKE